MLRFDRASTIQSAELVMGEAPSRASLKPPRVKTIATHESPKWTRSKHHVRSRIRRLGAAILFVPKASVRSQPTQQQSDASGARSSGKFPLQSVCIRRLRSVRRNLLGLAIWNWHTHWNWPSWASSRLHLTIPILATTRSTFTSVVTPVRHARVCSTTCERSTCSWHAMM